MSNTNREAFSLHTRSRDTQKHTQTDRQKDKGSKEKKEEEKKRTHVAKDVAPRHEAARVAAQEDGEAVQVVGFPDALHGRDGGPEAFLLREPVRRRGVAPIG